VRTYTATGAVLGAAIVAAGIFADLKTPRDISGVALLVALCPLYLPVGSAAISYGLSRPYILGALLASNGLLYALGGWVVWYLRGRSIAYRVLLLALAGITLHAAALLFEAMTRA